jgi:hypothetical protein
MTSKLDVTANVFALVLHKKWLLAYAIILIFIVLEYSHASRLQIMFTNKNNEEISYMEDRIFKIFFIIHHTKSTSDFYADVKHSLLI